MKTIEKIKHYIDFKGISLTAFDKSIGAGNAYIGKQISRGASIGSDVLQTIFSIYPDLNPLWVFDLSTEMIKSGSKHEDTPAGIPHVREPNAPYIAISPTGKTAITKQKTIPNTIPNSKNPGVKEYLNPKIITVDRMGNENIVWVNVRARAGYLSGYGDPDFMETLPSFNLPGLPHGTFRAFEVDGDSMFPTLKNREMVIGQFVESFDHIRDDRCYIIVHKTEGVLIKRVLNRIEKHGLLILKSDALDNRNLYPNLTVKPEDIQEIWYAVWHGGFDFQSPSDSWQRINNHEADITVLKNTVDALTGILKTAGLLK